MLAVTMWAMFRPLCRALAVQEGVQRDVTSQRRQILTREGGERRRGVGGQRQRVARATAEEPAEGDGVATRQFIVVANAHVHGRAEDLRVEFRRATLGFCQWIRQGFGVDAAEQKAGVLGDVLLGHAPVCDEKPVAALVAATTPEPGPVAASVAVR